MQSMKYRKMRAQVDPARRLVGVLLCLLLPLTLCARKWNAENIDMVYLKDSTQYVCNPDGVLGIEAVQTTNRLLRKLETDKGVQTVVVTVKQLEGDDPYAFGMALGKKYGVGSKRQRTGLIVVLATEDRSYQILTGNGLEGTLPDALCKRVENRVMVPKLKKGDWDAAIVETVQALDQIIRGDDTIVAEEEDDEGGWIALGVFVLICVGMLALFILLGYLSMKTCPKCGKKHSMTRSKEVKFREGRKRKKRVTWVCRHCGHTYETIEDDMDSAGLGGAVGSGPVIFGAGRGHGGSGRGGFGGFGGGSFGGGSFGGGGAGGRF